MGRWTFRRNHRTHNSIPPRLSMVELIVRKVDEGRRERQRALGQRNAATQTHFRRSSCQPSGIGIGRINCSGKRCIMYVVEKKHCCDPVRDHVCPLHLTESGTPGFFRCRKVMFACHTVMVDRVRTVDLILIEKNDIICEAQGSHGGWNCPGARRM